jgi:hypothetical protein
MGKPCVWPWQLLKDMYLQQQQNTAANIFIYIGAIENNNCACVVIDTVCAKIAFEYGAVWSLPYRYLREFVAKIFKLLMTITMHLSLHMSTKNKTNIKYGMQLTIM